jgi:uncharacterized sulfatase
MNARMKRRCFLGGAAGAIAASCRTAFRKGARPNFLFVLADDLSWDHVGAVGGAVRTPHFDRVAREGVRFTQSYCASPSCTASRSAILTGRYQWQVEEAGVLYGTLPPKYPLFTHRLQDAGYHVGFTGKGWGPGSWDAAGLKRHPLGREHNQRLFAVPPPQGISPVDYAANFAGFLEERPHGAPFFFWLGAREPHRIYAEGIGRQSGKRLEDVAVPPFWPDTPEIRSDILDYYYEAEWFDQQVGRALEALERAGELDNTMVIVTSDNGMPFPRAKTTLYDWGVHMPLAIRWGRQAPPDRVRDDFVSHIDLAPTILEAAGVEVPPGVAGRNLLPSLLSKQAGPASPHADCAFTGIERHTWCRPDGATYPSRAIRTRDFLYIRNFAPDRWPTGGPSFLSSNMTYHGDVDDCPAKTFLTAPANVRRYSRQYDLCFGKRPAEELYDLAKDPYQVNNAAGKGSYREIQARLRERLEDCLRKTGDPRIEGKDPWQGYVYHATQGYAAQYNRSLPADVRDAAKKSGPPKPE